MDKLLRYFPHLLIFSYLIRLLITGASLGDALVVLVFGLLVAGRDYLEHIREPEANLELKTRIDELEKTQDSIKSKVSSLTISGLRR